VKIDPTDVAVTDTYTSGPGLFLVRGLTVGQNGDVFVTLLRPSNTGVPASYDLYVYNATTQTPVGDIYSFPGNGPQSQSQYGHDVAVDNTGKTYVADAVTGTVKVYSGTGSPTSIDVPGSPVGLFSDADGKVYALVANDYADGVGPMQTRVSVVDVATNAIVGDAYTGPYNSANNYVADAAPAGNGKVYVTNPHSTTVSIVDTANPSAPPVQVDVNGTPTAVDYNETTGKVYVTVARSGAGNTATVSVVDITSGTAVPVGGAVYTIPSSQPNTSPTAIQLAKLSDIAVSPDGQRIFVTNAGNSNVKVVDAATGAVVRTIATSGITPPFNVAIGPLRVVFSPDGEHAYVVDPYGTVSEISFADSAINL
jgi:YVTN family beta-propeller protein